MPTDLFDVLTRQLRPALMVGNGANRHGNSDRSSWEGLLAKLAHKQGLEFTKEQMAEMSNTEFFDILDLAKPREDRSSLQREFCRLMRSWEPAAHHHAITRWAERHAAPIITVNFDENLSRSIGAEYFLPDSRSGFTAFYPWSSYFSTKPIESPRNNFAIWHAHGMMRYSQSIRLGLTHYMGSVQRARSWVYGKNGLRAQAKEGAGLWRGSDTWLEVLFFCPLLIMGFSFGKDESFLRWLFLERARLHKELPRLRQEIWFVARESSTNDLRRPFFEKLGIEFVIVSDYDAIYQNDGWGR